MDPYAIKRFCTAVMENDVDPVGLLHDADTSGCAAAKRSKQKFLQSNPEKAERFTAEIKDQFCSRHARCAANQATTV